MGREIYRNHYEYIEDELQKLNLMLRLAVARNKKSGGEGNVIIPGLVISQEYIESLFDDGESASSADERELEDKIQKKNNSINARYRISVENKKCHGIEHLRRTFRLSEREFQILIIALAPLVDPRYGKLYGVLQNSSVLDSPSMHTAVTLLGGDMEEGASIRACFSDHSPLIFWGLVRWRDDSHSGGGARTFSIDPRIADYIFGTTSLNSYYSGAVKLINRAYDKKNAFLNLETLQKVNHLAELLKNEPLQEVPFIYFQGEGYRDKETAAHLLASSLSLPLFIVDSARASEPAGAQIRNIFREVLLWGGVLFFTAAADPFAVTSVVQEMKAAGGFGSWIIIFDLPEAGISGDQFKILNHIAVDFVLPHFDLRKKIWETGVNGYRVENRENIFDELSDRFSFSSEQIERSVMHARNRSFLRGKNGEDYEISFDDFLEACRRQCSHKLSELGTRIEKSFSLTDIVLPSEQIEVLGEILSHYRHIRKVFTQWDFKSKVRYGRGISVLFAGDSGTGKTMAASILAGELDLEVYKIDLSGVVSKYIGETEKNLSKIFHEAERSGAILFFDEADALFGKRTEVKDAHDRYANIEVSYLLQKMEEYSGITILASNLKQNMDSAFTRRLRFVVDFPFPDKTYRRKIWESVFPDKAPLSGDIDFTFLSDKLELSGGHIKNIALAAGFIASSEGDEITMGHIMRAARREYQKLTRSFLKVEMEPYYHLGFQNKNTRSLS